jgi:hypothetical protein
MNTKTTTNGTNSPRTSKRSRLIVAAVVFAGIAGVTLAGAGVAGATSTTVNVAAASSAPVTVIDARQNPTGAQAAMALFDDATKKAFTNTTDPTFATTGWAAAPGGVAEENDGPAGSDPEAVSYSVTNATTASWSLGGSIGLKMGGGIGFADASVSLKLSADHTWGTTTGDTVNIAASVDPGQMVWIEEATTQATYTGTYSFTANGINYQVTNVTITTPVGADGNPLTAVNYRIVQQPISKVAQAVGATTNTFDAHKLTRHQLTELGNRLGLNK